MENGVTLTLSDFSSVVSKAAVNPVGLTRIFGANGGKDASERNAKSPDGFPSAFPQIKKERSKAAGAALLHSNSQQFIAL